MNVPEELYYEYKKKLLDLRTKVTTDVIEHMSEVARHNSPTVFDDILASDGDNLRFILVSEDDYKFVNIALYSEPEKDNEGNIINENKENYNSADIIDMLKSLEVWNDQDTAEVEIVDQNFTRLYEYRTENNTLFYKGKIRK